MSNASKGRIHASSCHVCQSLCHLSMVWGTRLFGNLHYYLKQRRKLKEGLAASIFRQIVLLVRDAHSKSVVLRNLRLKS